MALVGCQSPKEQVYIKDAKRGEAMDITNMYTSVIVPDDLLYIYVYSETPETTIPFNEETNKGDTKVKPQGYRVSANGNIHFPILGAIEAAGKTLPELASNLERRLRNENYVSDAIVNITMLNFHVAVIGEVKHPSILHSENGRLTIFEALAQCGDITMDGMRTNVVVVRHGQDEQRVDTLNLTRSQVLDSPCYYLQQNDIVYVEPTKKKKKKASRNEDWPRYVSSGASFLELAYRTIYQIARVSR